MNTKKVAAVFIVIIAGIAFVWFGGFIPSGPEKALKKFETSYNERDMEGIIGILKPSEQLKFKLAMELLGGAAEFANMGDIFSDEMLSEAFAAEYEDDIKIEVVSEKYNDKRDSALVTVKVICGDAENVSEVPMVKISDEWYINEEILF